MPDVVFDTVIFVRSLINPFGDCGRLVFNSTGYELIVSEPILREIAEVLARPELRRKYRGVPGRDPAMLLTLLARARVVNSSPIPATARDPKDDKFLAAAIAAKADYVVTEDQDLLIVGEYRGVRIVGASPFRTLLAKAEDRSGSE